MEGDVVKRTGRIMSVPVGEAAIAVSSMQSTADRRQGPVNTTHTRIVDVVAPALSIVSRSPSRCRPVSRRSTR